jgi:hypothetical protein
MHRSAAAAIAGGLLWIAPNPAFADAKDGKAVAAECIDSFENAQRAQKNGHLVFAHKLYSECVATACPKQVRHDCVQGQTDTDRALATVTVVVRDAAGNDVPATIKVDGNPFTPEPGRAQPIDPGPREFQYTVNGETKVTSITIAEGEKSRVIVLPAPTPDAPPTPPPPAPTPPPPRPPPENNTLGLVGPVAVGSVGLLLVLGGFGGMYLLAKGEADDRDMARAVVNDPSKTPNERQAAISSANSHNNTAQNDQLIGIIFLTAGVLFVATGATWYLLGQQNQNKRAQVVPVVTPHYAGSAFSLSF